MKVCYNVNRSGAMVYDDKLVDTDFNKVIGDVLKSTKILHR